VPLESPALLPLLRQAEGKFLKGRDRTAHSFPSAAFARLSISIHRSPTGSIGMADSRLPPDPGGVEFRSEIRK